MQEFTIKLNHLFSLHTENRTLLIFFVIRIFSPEPFQEQFSQPGGRLQKCNTPEVYKVITYIGKIFNIHILEIYFKIQNLTLTQYFSKTTCTRMTKLFLLEVRAIDKRKTLISEP